MSIFSVSDQIYYYVFLEGLSILRSKFNNSMNSLRIVRIYMQYGCRIHFSYITTIKVSSAVFNRSSIPNLIINYYMNGTTNTVLWNSCNCKRFINDTLSSKGCVSMELNIQNLRFVSIFILFGTCFSLRSRVYKF